MAEIINLRRARKARTRAEQAATAAANRRKFGRPKAERAAEAAEQARAAQKLDAHKLDD